MACCRENFTFTENKFTAAQDTYLGSWSLILVITLNSSVQLHMSASSEFSEDDTQDYKPGGGRAVAQLVEALRYKPKGCGSIFEWVIGIFH
jgi:hypothetical protein